MDASERYKERAADEAADWFARLHGEEMERSEREQFVEWLQQTPLHVAEMLRLAQVHESIKHFPRWSRLSTGPKTEADDDKVVQFPALADGDSKRPPTSPIAPRVFPLRPRSKRQVRTFGAFAAMMVLGVGMIFVLPRLGGHVIETDRGERREVVLADGSVLQVDPETRLRVKYVDTVRRVILERGRALFHVAKNPNRPFLVQADDTTVRAVGTAFGVEQHSYGVIVTVAEGKVSVSSPSRLESGGSAERADAIGHSPSQGERLGMRTTARQSENAAGSRDKGEGAGTTEVRATSSALRSQRVNVSQAGEIFLTANQQLRVQAGGAAEPVRDVESANVLAWAEGQLFFQNDEVGQAVAEFNRYNHVQLTVADPDLARKPVSGTFNAADPEAFIAFLQTVASVEIARDSDKTITIRLARRP